MKRKIICILMCALFLTMTFSVTSAEKITKNYEKDNNFYNVVLDNSPPTDPSITCPDKVKENGIFIARAQSIDPDGDIIYYRLMVGESGKPSQWIGPRKSGEEFATGMGIFNYIGEIVIGFQAKDINDAESNWSYHTINFTKSKFKSRIFNTFIQDFQLLNPFLQRLLERNIMKNIPIFFN